MSTRGRIDICLRRAKIAIAINEKCTMSEEHSTGAQFWLTFCFQVALVDVLRTLGIEPDGILGLSLGEVACAYADGCLTAEETVMTAYWRGRCIAEANLPAGAMALVGE